MERVQAARAASLGDFRDVHAAIRRCVLPNGKISDESPIGQALLGKQEGDKVEIATANENTTYKITGIS